MRSLIRRLAATLTVVGVVCLGQAVPAAGAPDARLKQVEAQVDALDAKAEAAGEEWNNARTKLAASQARIAVLKRKAATERRAYAGVAKDLGRLVSAMYKSGMIDLDVQAMFADDPTAFLAQMAAVEQIGMTQSVTLKRIQVRRLSLTQAESAVKAEQAIAQKYATQAAAHKKAADAALAKAEKILAGLQKAERVRLAKLRAAQAAKAARQAQQARSEVTKSIGGVSKRVQSVVRFALNQVGDRYRLGASGPSIFDCSGLMMASYRQIGISLPHYSRGQFSTTQRVSRASLRPGDLVFFFGRGIKHVGMYIGNNRFVHAANRRYGVIVSSLSDPYYLARTSGYGRVVR